METALQTRFLTFGGATVHVEYSGDRSARIVDFLFRRIPSADGVSGSQPTLRLSEDPVSGVFSLSCGGEVCCVDRSPGAVASWLLHATCRQMSLAGERANGLLLHAAAVALGGRGLLLPGATGSGKSTLTAFLTHQGFDYLTDELAHVPSESTCVEGFTAPLKIKQSGVGAVERYWSLNTAGGVRLAGVHDVLVQPDAACEAASVLLSAIVFPRYRPDSAFCLKALSPAQTGLRLMAGVLNPEALPEHGFRESARVAGLTAGYAMRYASLRQVEAHLELLRHITTGSGSSSERRVTIGTWGAVGSDD